MGYEIEELVEAINGGGPGTRLVLRGAEGAELEGLLARHPGLWPAGLADALLALRRRLGMEEVERDSIPEPLRDFIDTKYRRDLDPMALARRIGEDICGACAECECRC